MVPSFTCKVSPFRRKENTLRKSAQRDSDVDSGKGGRCTPELRHSRKFKSYGGNVLNGNI